MNHRSKYPRIFQGRVYSATELAKALETRFEIVIDRGTKRRWDTTAKRLGVTTAELIRQLLDYVSDIEAQGKVKEYIRFCVHLRDGAETGEWKTTRSSGPEDRQKGASFHGYNPEDDGGRVTGEKEKPRRV